MDGSSLLSSLTQDLLHLDADPSLEVLTPISLPVFVRVGAGGQDVRIGKRVERGTYTEKTCLF